MTVTLDHDLHHDRWPGAEADTAAAEAHPTAVRADWWDQASCRTDAAGLAHLFFSEELPEIARAKTICSECPVIAPCLSGALERREPFGVWGGQVFQNGRILAVKRRRGRPPKHPRPEDQLPEVPIPEHLRPSA